MAENDACGLKHHTVLRITKGSQGKPFTQTHRSPFWNSSTQVSYITVKTSETTEKWIKPLSDQRSLVLRKAKPRQCGRRQSDDLVRCYRPIYFNQIGPGKEQDQRNHARILPRHTIENDRFLNSWKYACAVLQI